MVNTLALKKADLYRLVGRWLGYGDGPDFGDRAWTTKQTAVIKDCVDSGCRNFYRPPPQSGINLIQWTFLTPVGSVTIDAASDSVKRPEPLPEDFGGFVSKLTVAVSDSSIYQPVDIINEARMRELFSTNPSTSGRPQRAAEVVLKGTHNDAPPRRGLIIYPIPDQQYTFRFQYSLLANALSDESPWAYGGEEHSETILESCLRIAEERYNDLMNGPHSQKFFECLAASVARDSQHKPHLIGYNADNSDALERGSKRWFADYWQPVTFNGLPMGSY
jgi:hypothetical protein